MSSTGQWIDLPMEAKKMIARKSLIGSTQLMTSAVTMWPCEERSAPARKQPSSMETSKNSVTCSGWSAWGLKTSNHTQPKSLKRRRKRRKEWHGREDSMQQQTIMYTDHHIMHCSRTWHLKMFTCNLTQYNTCFMHLIFRYSRLEQKIWSL